MTTTCSIDINVLCKKKMHFLMKVNHTISYK